MLKSCYHFYSILLKNKLRERKDIIMAKVTMQDIADSLGISRVTVWKIFNNQEGVSDALRIQVLKKAEELGYNKGLPKAPPLFPKKHRIVSVIISRPESSVFWMNIIHRTAQEFMNHEIDLIYNYVPSACPPDYVLPSTLTDGTVEGCIILNVYDVKMMQLINDLPIPKVFLDTATAMPLDSLNGDLVLLEGVDTVCKLTDYVIQKGRTRIGFVGDINYAYTNAHRYEGFQRAMKKNHLEVDPALCYTESIDIFSYQLQLHQFLENLDRLPEAFICVSDYVAHFLQLYFSEHDIRVPEDVALTGYDGSSEYFNVAEILTTVDVKTALLGKRLAAQLMFRMENPEGSKEIIYIMSDTLYKASTDF